jgi:hypothetical protein
LRKETGFLEEIKIKHFKFFDCLRAGIKAPSIFQLREFTTSDLARGWVSVLIRVSDVSVTVIDGGEAEGSRMNQARNRQPSRRCGI